MEVEVLNDIAEVSQECDTISASSIWLDEISLQALKSYSKSLLHDIVFGDNSANERRLLREIYWRTIEALADLEYKILKAILGGAKCEAMRLCGV